MSGPESFRIDLDADGEAVRRRLARAAELWEAEWRPDAWGGSLTLPLSAGVRSGWASGRVRIESRPGGSRLVYEVEERGYRLRWPAIAILALGAAGGLAATLWPFYPPLLGVAPLAVVLAFAAWLLVASRLTSSTVDDFLELVAGLDPAAADALVAERRRAE